LKNIGKAAGKDALLPLGVTYVNIIHPF